MTSALSIWIVRSLNDVRRSSVRERLEIDAVGEDAVRWNELLDEGEDLESHLETTVAAWKKSGTPVDHLDWAYMQGESPAAMAEIVSERYRDRPISLGIEVPWASSKP
jgi:3-methyladenine DNA glycosylase Tag